MNSPTCFLSKIDMGFLTDFLCCRRKRKIDAACKACTLKAPIENVHLRRRRYTIPKRPKENVFQLLKYIKFSSDGTSIFVPVEIHEPLSFLQKLAEPFEYSELLDKAAESFDPAGQLKYIAAFSHAFALKMRERHTRPFDALLGETYELDRTMDKGFKFMAEQLSIAPKLAALHCSGIGWECRACFEYTVHMQTKFISIQPNIRATIILDDVDSEFSFPLNLTYKLHNILFGEAFFDVYGTTEIVEKRNPEHLACRLEYLSKFGEKPNDSPDMIGTITKNNQTLMNVRGTWKRGLEIRSWNSASDASAGNWESVLDYHPLPKESEETYYFTEFASQLNEMEHCIAPTDSRLRSDIRDLENGKLKTGNVRKRRAVTAIYDKLETVHFAINEPFVYLIHFLVHTRTFQNLFMKLASDRSSITSSMLSYEVDPERFSKKKTDRKSLNYQRPRSYSVVEALNELNQDKNPIYVPTELHEPLSLLQRLTEVFEFSLMLDKSASSIDFVQQLTSLAAFSILSYSTLFERVTKPFTPLLGETYECDRLQNFGWKCISEQVDHVRPTTALHCEAKKWICRQEIAYEVEFHKTFISIGLNGYMKVELLEHDCEYLWNGNNIKIYNNVVGELIPEVQGTTTIVGLRKAKGYKCSLRYTPRQELVDENLPDIEGLIAYKSQPLALIDGTWRDGISASVIKPIKNTKVENVLMAADFKLIYKKPPIPSGRKLLYNMSNFACSLNEKVNGVAPTDSRYREDIIALDMGLIDKSSMIANRLEEKQLKRMSHNLRKASAEQYKPAWFVKNDAGEWIFNGEYWNCKRMQDWSKCPEIF